MHTPSYQTSDWYLCVFLIAKGFSLLDVDRSNRMRCQFLFEASDALHEEVQNFWHNGAIGVQDFVAAVKKAKAIFHSDSF